MNKRGELKNNNQPETWVGMPKVVPAQTQSDRAIATAQADIKQNSTKVIAAFQALCKEMLEKNYEVSWGYGKLYPFKALKDVVAYLQSYIKRELRGDYRLLLKGEIITLYCGFFKSDFPGGTYRRPNFMDLSQSLLEGKDLTRWIVQGEEPEFVTVYIIPAINMQKVKPLYFIVGETGFNKFINGGLAERVKDTAKFVIKLSSDLLRKKMLHAIPQPKLNPATSASQKIPFLKRVK